jgi:hypothetical protein
MMSGALAGGVVKWYRLCLQRLELIRSNPARVTHFVRTEAEEGAA